MRKFILLISAVVMSYFTPAIAEIQDITVTFIAAACQPGCDTLLEKYYRQVYGVDDVKVNRGGGQLNIKWKPNARLTFTDIDTPLRMTGIEFNEIRIKAKGMMRHDKQNFILVSDGDQTPLYLLGTIKPQVNQYVIEDSPYNRILSQDIQQKLLEAEKNGQAVTITGPVFEPYRSPPLQIIVEKVEVEKSQNP